MKMIVIVFRQSLDHDLLNLLETLDVKAFTQAPEVWGQGESGHAFGSFSWPGCNSLLLAAMPDARIAEILSAIRRFRDDLSRNQHGASVPLHVFTVPCEQVL